MSRDESILEEDCSEDRLGAGYLILTDKSLKFYTGKARVLTFSKDMQKALEINLQDIKNVRGEGVLIKKLVLELNDGRVFKFGVLSNKKWKDAIDAARARLGNT
jgi:hypothetical protein